MSNLRGSGVEDGCYWMSWHYRDSWDDVQRQADALRNQTLTPERLKEAFRVIEDAAAMLQRLNNIIGIPKGKDGCSRPRHKCP